jgi:hypothetical protein
MANILADVIRVFDTDTNTAAALREKMIGAATDTFDLLAKFPGGTVKRYAAVGSVDHSTDLTNLNTTNYFHLTQAEYDTLVSDGNADDFHYHTELWKSDGSAVAVSVDASGNSTFVGALYSGNVTPSAIARFNALETITDHAHYGFLDSSVINFSGVGVQGHASYSDDVEFTGTANGDHHNSFQAGPLWNSSGTLTYMGCLLCAPGVSAGTVNDLWDIRIPDAIKSGGGTILRQYGIFIAPLDAGNSNWGIYDYNNDCYFGGKIGIRVDNPSEALHVRGTARFGRAADDARYTEINTGSGIGLQIVNAISTPFYETKIGVNNDDTWFNATSGLDGTGAQLFLKASNGFVGVNTVSPGSRFSVGGGHVSIDSTWGYVWYGGNEGIFGNTTNHEIGFNTNDVERMVIDNTGVGIGGVGPDSKLHVTETSATTNDLIDVAIINAICSGTAIAGFGPSVLFRGEALGGYANTDFARIGAYNRTGYETRLLIETCDTGGSYTPSETMEIYRNSSGKCYIDAIGNELHVNAALFAGSDTNYTKIDASGHLTFAGNGRPFLDELGSALILKTQGPGVSTDAEEGVIVFDSGAVYSATWASADVITGNYQLNHDKDLTTDVKPHIHWFQAKNASPNFLMSYRWQKNGGAKTTAWTLIKCNNLAHTYVSGTLNQISYSAAISPPVGTALSDILQIRIYRDTDNSSGLFSGADPYNDLGAASVSILSVDVHKQINSFGSDQEWVK